MEVTQREPTGTVLQNVITGRKIHLKGSQIIHHSKLMSKKLHLGPKIHDFGDIALGGCAMTPNVFFLRNIVSEGL